MFSVFPVLDDSLPWFYMIASIIVVVAKFITTEDDTINIKPLTAMGKFFDVGNRKCEGSYFTEQKNRFPNKISGGIWERLNGLGGGLEAEWNTRYTGDSHERYYWDREEGRKIIEDISPTGPFHVTAGASLEERKHVCKLLKYAFKDMVFDPVDPADEALSTLSSCKCPDNVGAFIGFGKSTMNVVLFVEIGEDGYAHSSTTQAFSMQDHEKAAMFAAIVVRECIARGKRVLIAGSPTIPKYNEPWITDGSVDKQFITVSPLELSSKIVQLGEKGTDAITIIQRMVDLLFL